jgi:aminoglycoside phosphotransferase (APT) family kinase protein
VAEPDGLTGDDLLVERLAPEPAVRAWIGDRLPGEGPFRMKRVTTGHSNELFSLERDGHRFVLRRPPRVSNSPRAHDMAREFRVQRALHESGVPHAEAFLLCEDDDVIGAPFYVMEHLDGLRLYDDLPAPFDEPAARRRVAEELFDALAAIHDVDWRAVGLDDFGRPDNFTARQADRWMRQLASYRTRDLPDLDAAARWLCDHVPTTQRATLIHGDYGLHNVLYAREQPTCMIGVVDWETATIGDPLMDLGYLAGLWLEGDEPQRWIASALPYDVAGFPGRAELTARYASRTGLELTDLAWYRAMAQLKVACILEGSYARFVRGDADDAHLATFEHAVPNHAAYALAITRGEA